MTAAAPRGQRAGPAVVDLFYPIVPDAAWVGRIAPLGIRSVQLRLKHASSDEVDRQVAASLAACTAHGVTLIVNDHWEAALRLGAPYVHLGQEDLAGADVAAIRAAGVGLGLSTHDEAELARALAVGPDYVALGPIYETKLKAMTWAPQGLDRIASWKATIGALPLVAIGGLTPERAPAVVAAGADSLAVVTDIITHAEPEARIAAWLATCDGLRRERR